MNLTNICETGLPNSQCPKCFNIHSWTIWISTKVDLKGIQFTKFILTAMHSTQSVFQVATFGQTLPKRYGIWNTPMSFWGTVWFTYSNTVQLVHWYKLGNGTSFPGSPGAYRSHMYCFVCRGLGTDLSILDGNAMRGRLKPRDWGTLYFKVTSVTSNIPISA